MLTTPLIVLLSAVPVLGEEGESCRTDADCLSSLACTSRVCTPRPAPAAPPSRSVPSVPAEPAPSLRTEEPPPAAEVVTETSPADETPRYFTGVHFVLGAMAGAGPMWTKSSGYLLGQPQEFEAFSAQIPMELRIGVLFGRFELMAEVAPATLALMAAPIRHFSAALSAGFMLPLYENGDFSVSLPLRARGGVFLSSRNGGPLVGGSAGVGLRFGRALVELRALAEYRHVWAGSSFAVPVDLSFSWIF
ncbi:MAG: hypothetical protein JNJ54_30045 [Myxococcaceae bacterium]|nr:hypothetical protein [Myxococcaceae bacterium]